MEILIVISAGIAFGALIAYLWSSYRDLNEKNRLLEIAESRLAALSGETGHEPTAAAVNEDGRVAELERQIHDLTRERSELRTQLEGMESERISSPEPSDDTRSAISELSERIAKLDSENSVLRSRIVDLEGERNGTREKIVVLQEEHDRLSEFEERIATLQGERSDLAERLKLAESEREAQSRRILELEGLEAKVPDLEARATGLSAHNAQLLTQISELQTSIRGKIKTQLDALQELYRKLDSGNL
jgi:chromosome segregation ATPase